MKIFLKNFRCHGEKTFEIPDKGLIALSGKKGRGKSTLIQSIVFAFFGECDVKPTSHGKNDCGVVLEYNSLIITRTTKPTPHRLSVKYQDNLYTDATAQTIINKILGVNYEEFMASSYIVQRSHNSVISMTPTEQIKFIEKLSFSDEDRHIYQKKIKNKIKEIQEDISYLEGKISSLTEHLTKEKARMPKMSISAPEDIPDIDELKKYEEKTRKAISDNEKRIKKLQEEIQKYRKEMERKNTILEQKKILEIELKQLQRKREELGHVITDEELENKQRENVSLFTNIDNMRKYKAYLESFETAKKNREDAIKKINMEIDHFKIPTDEKIDELREEYDELIEKKKQYEIEREEIERDRFFRENADEQFNMVMSEIKNTFDTLKTSRTHLILIFLGKKTKKISKEIDTLALEIDKIHKLMTEKEICGETYNCPKCNQSLYFSEGSLHISETTKEKDVIDKDIFILKNKELAEKKNLNDRIILWIDTIKKISGLVSKKPMEYSTDFNEKLFLEIRDRLVEYQNKKEGFEKYKKELEDLLGEDINKYPLAVKNLYLAAEEKKKFLPKKFEPYSDIVEMEERYEKNKIEIVEEQRKINEWNTLKKEIQLRETKINTINGSLSKTYFLKEETPSIQTYEMEYDQLRGENNSLNEKLRDNQKMMNAASDYILYQKEVARIDELSSEIDKLKEDLKINRRRLEGAFGLLTSDKEAQIMSLKTTISKINMYSKFYLEKVFMDDHISVSLHSHKLTQKGDFISKINTVINYKGEVYNSFKELSGGESQQCELAFLFGVNDMLGSNIIFLDECINNLDSDTNMKTVETLKKIKGDKLIIVVAHEAVLGIFDKVIEF